MIVAVEYEFVPEATERRLAARPAHREWLAALKADGRLGQAGPFADGRGARGHRCSTSRTECPRRETTDQTGVGADSLS